MMFRGRVYETGMLPMPATISEGSDTASPPHLMDRSARDIIAVARRTQAQRRPQPAFLAGLVCSAISGVLFWGSFAPLNWSALAWVAPVPLLLLVRIVTPARRTLVASYVGGLLFYVPALQWLRLGDPTMYVAWMALAGYLACTFPVMVALCRVAVHRLRLPLVVVAPLVWVGLEYAKAHLFTGFAWYFLGHTQYRWLELIQISDLFGAYGVSFVMMFSAAALAQSLPDAWFLQLRLLPPGDWPQKSTAVPSLSGASLVTPARRWPVVVSLLLVGTTLGYGYVRRAGADFKPGPRMALIQGNFLASLRIPAEDFAQQYVTHMRLTALAVREQPDVIVWPEGMFRWPLASAPAGLSSDELQQLAPQVPPTFWREPSVRETLVNEAQKTGAALIFGMECVDLQPTGKIHQTNSAVLIRPDTGLSGRYDKNHLVPFGEYLPLKKTLPWLQKFTPYPPDFGVHAGSAASIFSYGNYRMLPVICFEDTVPHLVRGMVAAGSPPGEPGVDVIVNLSNDGWFQGSSGLDQHLITAAFRAVECRTPVVRAVNTGVSAFVDGDGAILAPEVFIDGDQKGRTSMTDPQTGRWYRQLNAALVSTVPLDHRTSLYVRWGDWFAALCLTATLFLGLMGFAGLFRGRPIPAPVTSSR